MVLLEVSLLTALVDWHLAHHSIVGWPTVAAVAHVGRVVRAWVVSWLWVALLLRVALLRVLGLWLMILLLGLWVMLLLRLRILLLRLSWWSVVGWGWGLVGSVLIVWIDSKHSSRGSLIIKVHGLWIWVELSVVIIVVSQGLEILAAWRIWVRLIAIAVVNSLWLLIVLLRSLVWLLLRIVLLLIALVILWLLVALIVLWLLVTLVILWLLVVVLLIVVLLI